MRYLKKGTNIGKIEAKGNSRIKIQCEMGQSGTRGKKLAVISNNVSNLMVIPGNLW